MPSVPRGELLNVLEAVKGAVAEKTFAPILTHVLVEGNSVLGYDSNIGVKATMSANFAGSFNVNFELLFNLMKALDGDTVEVEVVGKRINITCGSHRSHLLQMDEEYPKPDLNPSGAAWKDVPAGFREAMERALIACHQSEREKLLGCVLIRGSRLYATDRQRGVRCTVPGLDVPEMLLDSKAVGEVVRLGNPTRVMVAGAWALWDYTNLKLLTRVREGAKEFPPLDRVFTESMAKDSVAIPSSLGPAVTRLALFAAKKDGSIHVAPVDGGVELSAEAEFGRAVERIDLEADGQEPKLFSPERLLSALPYAEGMTLGTKSFDAIYLRGTTAGFEFILSPMRPS